jgi:hypothetical protein
LVSGINHIAIQQWQRDGHSAIDCISCGYKHLHPFPTTEELDILYKKNYHQQKWHFPYNEVNAEFIDHQFKYLLQNVIHRSIYDKVQRNTSPQALQRMIDIGGGNNLLARYFMEFGWSSIVLEPNREAGDYLRQFDIEVVQSMFEQMDPSRLGKFSFINIEYVLEHVLDPLAMIVQTTILMTPESLVRICVPNDFSPGQMAWLSTSQLDPPWISYPDHINYFNFESLSRLLQRAGLKEISRTTTFPLEFLLLSGTDYYSDPSLRSKVNPAITGFENAWIQSGQAENLDALYEHLAKLGMGRSAIIYAKLA